MGSDCGFGYIKRHCVNSLMYADDLILLSISINHLPSLLDICLVEFEKLGSCLVNLEKSACLQIAKDLKNCQQCIRIKGAPFILEK